MAEIEIGLGKSGRRAYGFDDIAIVPSRRTRDPEDVDLGGDDGGHELFGALRRYCCCGNDARGLDLANALGDELGLHRFAVDLLHTARRFFYR